MAAPKLPKKDPVQEAIQQQAKEAHQINDLKQTLRIMVRNFKQLGPRADYNTRQSFGKCIVDFVSQDQHTVAAAASLFCDEFYIESNVMEACAEPMEAERSYLGTKPTY